MRVPWILIAVLIGVGLAGAEPCAAQSMGPSSPAALIITYRAKPGERLTLLTGMRKEGIAQFEKWKSEGVFSSYLLLRPAYAAAGKDTPDLYLILEFAHFVDLARWQQIERQLPGGLPPDLQSIAWADSAGTADIVRESTAAQPTDNSQYFILTYQAMIPMPDYEKYARGYAIPQFEGWMKAGVLNSFRVFDNQNPAGAPWTSVILLEYKDIDALGRREVVKDDVRRKLAASNPEWKKWSQDKSDLRKELSAIPVLSLK